MFEYCTENNPSSTSPEPPPLLVVQTLKSGDVARDTVPLPTATHNPLPYAIPRQAPEKRPVLPPIPVQVCPLSVDVAIE